MPTFNEPAYLTLNVDFLQAWWCSGGASYYCLQKSDQGIASITHLFSVPSFVFYLVLQTGWKCRGCSLGNLREPVELWVCAVNHFAPHLEALSQGPLYLKDCIWSHDGATFGGCLQSVVLTLEAVKVRSHMNLLHLFFGHYWHYNYYHNRNYQAINSDNNESRGVSKSCNPSRSPCLNSSQTAQKPTPPVTLL